MSEVASAAFFVSFTNIALNANGLTNPIKIAAIQDIMQSFWPHALVIGETKSQQPVTSHLHLLDYDLHENPGQPTSIQHQGKWES
ncbi:hypothetical protein Hypma_003752 [Hypsizygus marmoreus]|uniref:Uncharacterized protein n=1 Tax=Hypsizygus marmoreus TaxID=39966 RepID=A0A369J5H9_HYPMA|nr:hypothetical protein Hypma_003752 [Hypsizygus marmoreus]